MVRQSVSVALLAGLVAAGVALPAKAGECCNSAPCAPSCCVQWVPQPYQCTRTAYRTECKQETYTAYRCETVPETRTHICTVYRRVPECRTETRTVCVMVPTVEERTVMQAHWTCQPVTTTCRRCVDRGHWECREVPCCEKRHHSWFARLRHHKHDCCESCCDSCCPPPMRTERVWVPCKVWEEVPVTSYRRVCEYRPVTCRVTVCRRESRQEQYQVTCWKCVPEQRTETYQVCVSHQVPYQATRTVSVCVPYQETVTLTRMVPQTVAAPAPCAETSCCKVSCCENSCCETTCCKKHHWSWKRSCHSHRHSDCGCGCE